MATLLDLWAIEANAALAPSPGESADIVAARELRNRTITAAIKRAYAILSDQAPLPSQDPQRTASLEAIAWARATVQNPASSGTTLFRLALAANAGATPAQILAAPDGAIENVIPNLIPALAKGARIAG